MDADNSGFLDLREFLLAIELVAARTPEEKLIWAFRQYDRDNSSQLDQIELTKAVKSIYNMLKSIGESPKQDPDEKAKAMFTQIDINSDGFLTMEEFLRKIHHFLTKNDFFKNYVKSVIENSITSFGKRIKFVLTEFFLKTFMS